MSVLVRAVGALTAAYSAALLVKPEVLAGPCGLVDEWGDPLPGVATLTRAVGARDLVGGLAVALAPAGRPLDVAVASRVAADLGDAVVLGTLLPRDKRGKAAAVAAGWGALTVAAALVARR
ncbi:hypothetical protein [Actinomadura parmotrematis]|uniref:DUF4267 domain-containing protein n=1 Tax=Actinomadura parmotrematis TaxID=2864039 RepID=A0ABS7FMN1_9ACTN|nr:hypothetical protein [Actinomadura parmotrematis]MBW8481633.1 hypothetical protein [Actinomadura parmotrematis]